MGVLEDWLQELGICILTFDGPGYAESDPNPKRSPKNDAFDIQNRFGFQSNQAQPEMIGSMVLALAVILVGYAIKPPPPKICGPPGGPPVTSPRIKLKDGRHLAYGEAGVSKEEAKYKVVVIHGFNISEDLNLLISQSDPYPKRSVKSEAYDVQELADALQLGPRFYVIGISMGACPAYSCLKHIPVLCDWNIHGSLPCL
ncbi:LOW QUALITY PROTEIN: hypothetical protein Cgig2_010862 [Carnegiea gigantea]|uniref:AB hydrolase-1 domain-containing protein n=1 Tax=Carnegiea gigantea TaxID=171969 RepID=A0A9Q1GMM1_9CARY|nr:LOW QUALITY PROTEIN: hypothetical protein Cgig2_010862 [Carnegiea gigantea]